VGNAEGVYSSLTCGEYTGSTPALVGSSCDGNFWFGPGTNDNGRIEVRIGAPVNLSTLVTNPI